MIMEWGFKRVGWADGCLYGGGAMMMTMMSDGTELYNAAVIHRSGFSWTCFNVAVLKGVI